MIRQRQQSGMALIELLLWGVVAIFVATLAMRLVPAYTEFFEVERIIKVIAKEASIRDMDNREIRESFEKHAMVNNVTSVKSEDLKISREGGRTVVSVDYYFETGLLGNVSLLVDFSASSNGLEKNMTAI